MQFLLDNLVATIIAATMALVLLATKHDQLSQNVERIRHYSTRQMEMNFVETLRFDMHRVVCAETMGMLSDSTFVVQAIKSDTQLDKKVRIVYRLRRTGSFAGQPIYGIDRTVQDGPGLGLDGSGTEICPTPGISFGLTSTTETARVLQGVSRWEIASRNDQNQAVATPDLVKAVYVRFGVLGTLSGTQQGARMRAVPEMNWEATYRPPYLRANFLGLTP